MNDDDDDGDDNITVVSQACLAKEISPAFTDLCDGYVTLNATFLTRNCSATFVYMPIAADPDSGAGVTWLKQARAVQARLEAAFPTVGISLAQGASEDLDAVDAVYGAFPTMIGITAAFILTLVAMCVSQSACSIIALSHSHFVLCGEWEGWWCVQCISG